MVGPSQRSRLSDRYEDLQRRKRASFLGATKAICDNHLLKGSRYVTFTCLSDGRWLAFVRVNSPELRTYKGKGFEVLVGSTGLRYDAAENCRIVRFKLWARKRGISPNILIRVERLGPDFLCLSRDKKLYCLEVKSREGFLNEIDTTYRTWRHLMPVYIAVERQRKKNSWIVYRLPVEFGPLIPVPMDELRKLWPRG
jgi:hypothetical protein